MEQPGIKPTSNVRNRARHQDPVARGVANAARHGRSVMLCISAKTGVEYHRQVLRMVLSLSKTSAGYFPRDFLDQTRYLLWGMILLLQSSLNSAMRLRNSDPENFALTSGQRGIHHAILIIQQFLVAAMKRRGPIFEVKRTFRILRKTKICVEGYPKCWTRVSYSFFNVSPLLQAHSKWALDMASREESQFLHGGVVDTE